MSGVSGGSFVDAGVAERTADAVLHAAGGRTVVLRMSAMASMSEAEQLGLATPRFQDAVLGPAAFRKTGNTKTLLISARAVRTTLHAAAATSAESLFRSAVGLVVDGDLYRIESVVAMGSSGQPHCWAVRLIAPVS